jgi:hypothetical protein
VFLSDTSLYSDVERLSIYLLSGAINCIEFMSTTENSNSSDQENIVDDYVVISSSSSIEIIQNDNR